MWLASLFISYVTSLFPSSIPYTFQSSSLSYSLTLCLNYGIFLSISDSFIIYTMYLTLAPSVCSQFTWFACSCCRLVEQLVITSVHWQGMCSLKRDCWCDLLGYLSAIFSTLCSPDKSTNPPVQSIFSNVLHVQRCQDWQLCGFLYVNQIISVAYNVQL